MGKTWLTVLVLALFISGTVVCLGDLPRHVDPSESTAGDPYPAEFAELYGSLFDAIGEEDYGAALEVLGLGAEIEALPETLLIIDRYNELIVEEISSLNKSYLYLTEAANYLRYVQTEQVDDALLRSIMELSDANLTLSLLFEVSIQLGNRLGIPQDELLDDLRKASEVLEDYYLESQGLGEINDEKEYLISERLLRKTLLEIRLEDDSVYIGDLILVRGSLGIVDGAGLSRELEFYVDGVYIGRAVTDSDGVFYVGFPTPEVYNGDSTVWAEFWPSGGDIDVYTPTRSNSDVIAIDYLVPEFGLDEPVHVYPGRTTSIYGTLTLEGEPVAGIDLSVTDGSATYGATSGEMGEFTVDVFVPETAKGVYLLTFDSAPRGVIGPSEVNVSYPVSHVPLTVDWVESRVNYAGGFLSISGSVSSMENASYFISFQAEGVQDRFTTTSSDGVFSFKVPLALSLSSAWYSYNLDVKSNRAWVEEFSATDRFIVLNPLIPAGALVVASYLVLYRKKYAALLMGGDVDVSTPLEVGAEGDSAGSASVFDVIKGLFGYELGESQTLREYLAGLGGHLGSQVLEKVRSFVLLYERWLYGNKPGVEGELGEAGAEVVRRLRDEG